MSLLEYARVLIQRGWVMALCALLAAGGMYLYSIRQPVIYRATQIVLIQPARADASRSLGNRSLVTSYAVYLNSVYVAQDIADSLGLGISGTALKGRAEIAARPDQLVIEINVNDADGETANRVAFAWGEKLVQYRQTLNENLPTDEHVYAVLQDFPRYTQYRPRTLVNMALGGMAGLLVGGLMVFALELRHHRRVHHPQDLSAFVHDAVFAVIPHESLSHHPSIAPTALSNRRTSHVES